MDGGGSLATGTIYGTKQKFKNDPVASFAQFGYTEYLELEYDQSVYGTSCINLFTFGGRVPTFSLHRNFYTRGISRKNDFHSVKNVMCTFLLML